MKPKKIFFVILAIISVALISLATFAFWKLLNQIVEDILLKFGIINIYVQLSIIIISCLIILFVLSLFYKKLKITKVVKDILKL